MNRSFGTARPHGPRVSPDGSRVAWIEERGGAENVVVRRLRGGPIQQITATEKDVTAFSWSPDGRAIAYLTEHSLRIARLRGGDRLLLTHPADIDLPRWSPDGVHIGIISRSRGWGQVVLVPSSLRKPLTQVPPALTPVGVDVLSYDWNASGRRIVYEGTHPGSDGNHVQLAIIDLDSAESPGIIAGRSSWVAGGRWVPDNRGIVAADDESGYFHVVQLSDTGERREIAPADADDVMAGGETDDVPTPSPDGRLVAFLRFEPGSNSVQVRRIDDGSDPVGSGVEAHPGTWSSLSWLPDSRGLVALGQSESTPTDIWILPLEGSPTRVTQSGPLSLSLPDMTPQVMTISARDGMTLAALLYLPANAKPGAMYPTLVNGHGGPTWQHLRSWDPLLRSIVDSGYAYLSVDFRGSTGYGRAFRQSLHNEWGHADVHDLVDAARWARDQAWSDGRLGVIGGSYGGYLTLCALVDEPELWSVGVDRYGDSDIALSYRLGDRAGRLDLDRQMGHPDNEIQAPLFRRGSPIHQTELIQAPLLMLHGKNDLRVVPRMTENMSRQMKIEGKHHEVIWFDDEGHGWRRRENQRLAADRTLDFLLAHMPPEE